MKNLSFLFFLFKDKKKSEIQNIFLSNSRVLFWRGIAGCWCMRASFSHILLLLNFPPFFSPLEEEWKSNESNLEAGKPLSLTFFPLENLRKTKKEKVRMGNADTCEK